MTPFVPEKLVIFDYSGTLSLEAPRFARPENLVSALAESGLARLGVATPETFWGEIVGPTWDAGSMTAIGYKRIVAQRIEALGLASDFTRTEITASSSRFVDQYLAQSRIDSHWHPLLDHLTNDPGVCIVVATDHYAEATETLIRHLQSWNIQAQEVTKAAKTPEPSAAHPSLIANSADIGFWKSQRQFWETVKLHLPVTAIRSILIIDDFGFNEEQGDSRAEQARVEARQNQATESIEEVFQTSLTIIPFFLKGAERDHREAGARRIAETVDLINRSLSFQDGTEKGFMNENGCKPQISYPCRWVYKVIGRDLAILRGAVAEVLSGRDYSATPSHSSKGGGYHCLNVEMTVENESVRLGFYEKLRRHPATIMVM